MPTRLISSVRGMGVALSVSTSTLCLSFLIASLCLHAEALLLVHHEQSEVLEAHVLLEQAVGADDAVDLATGQPVDHHLRPHGR
ncbi:MAG: hypothetical protein V9E89_00585 [Ilumatobacteraceae bacterium]